MNLWENFVTVMSKLGASNMLVRGLFIKLMGMPVFVRNPVYHYAYRKQRQYVMKKYYQSPQEVAIENTNACNLRCITCPHSKMKRSVGFMDEELYQKIIDECVQFKVRHVSIGGFGEPLLDSSLIDKVRYAKYGVEYLSTITNGIPLTQELGRELVKSGLDLLRVSIDAATSDTYTKVRPPGKLEVVEENLIRFIEFWEQQKKRKPLVEVRFVPTPENIHEIAHFKKKWKVADRVVIEFTSSWTGSVNTDTTAIRNPKLAQREACPLLWATLNISWDGKIPLCCLDYENEVVLGDAREESIGEVWGNEKLSEIRRAHLNLDFSSVPICGRCDNRPTWWIQGVIL